MDEEMLMQVSDDLLPISFKNVIMKCDEKTEIRMRSSVCSSTEIRQWIEEFSKRTKTSWILRKSRPNKSKKLLCSQTFICHHSKYGKSSSKSLKNFDCQAYILFSIKLTTASTKKRDKFVKDGLPAKITISCKHSHTLKTAAALSFLRPDDNVRACFEKYFQNGLHVSEAIKFHEDTFLEDDSKFEEILANANNLYPKVRTVRHWHDEWRKLNFETRTDQDIYEVMCNKQASYKEKGIFINYQKDPLAIAVVTPLMQRAHQLPFAKDVVFIDSTASSNAENHVVTFFLTPCVAGAVPLGIIITRGQTTQDYIAGFKLLQTTVKEPFGGVGYPSTFMTDDNHAEREALKAVWGDSNRFLSHFHISQAVWRWLIKKENQIDENDRQYLYKSFKSIMISLSKEEAFRRYGDTVNSDLIRKYQNFGHYIETHWKRKEDWVLAYRNVSIHNNHTNNFCEASVRLFKDLVLGRAKACNVVSLVDYTSVLIEEYYVARLQKFAHSSSNSPRLLLNKKLSKAAYLDESKITVMGNNLYSVPSESRRDVEYTVDTQMGSCSCYAGSFGDFCKHQAAIFFFCQEASPSAPGVTMAACYDIAILAYGESANRMEFYQAPMEQVQEEIQEALGTIPMDEDEASGEDLRACLEALVKCHKKFGTSKCVLNKTTQRLGKVTTRKGWESFLNSAGVFIR